MPTYYDQPRMGQTFIRRHNEKSYEYGMVVSLTVDGTFVREGKTFPEWAAVIQYGVTSEARINARTEIVPNSSQWLPVPEADASLAERLARAESTVETLTNALSQVAEQVEALSEAVANLAAGPQVTVLQPTNITPAEEPPAAPEALRLVESAAPATESEPEPVVARRRRG